MINKLSNNKTMILLFIFLNLFQLQKSNIKKIETWCFLFCGTQLRNFLFLFLLTIMIAIFIYLFIQYSKNSNLTWLLLTPLVFPILVGKGNENRELGLAFMQSNEMGFVLPWNGVVFTEQYLYNLIFKNIALLFSNYYYFLFFSRFLIVIFLIYSVSKIFHNYQKLDLVLYIYLANIFSLSFGGEYLLLGSSPRTIAYSFGFLSIYLFNKRNLLYLVTSIFACLFHLHVYYLMILPFLFFKSIFDKNYKEVILNIFTSTGLLTFFLFANFSSQPRSNFINNIFLKNADGIYINRIIAEQIIPFHVRPFNFNELNQFIGINEYWNIGFINLLLILLIYITSEKRKGSEFSYIVNLNLIFIMLALFVTFLDVNSFFIILYLFKTAVFLSLFLFINSKFKISIPTVAIIFSLIFANWSLEFSSSYLEIEAENNKFDLIEEYSDDNSVLVIDNNLKPLFASKSIQLNFEEYFIGNNLMDKNEIDLRKKLYLNSKSFCEELDSNIQYFVVSPILLDCEKSYLFTVNTNYGNTGILGDPFFKYNEIEGEGFCSDSCIRFYRNN